MDKKWMPITAGILDIIYGGGEALMGLFAVTVAPGLAGGGMMRTEEVILWAFLIPIIIFGIADGMNVTSIQTLLAGLTPMEYRAAFMSVNATVLRLGLTLGPLLMRAIFGVWGIAGVFYAGASLSIVTFMLMVIMLK